ncbi:MAG TPA: LysR family transcriptional regulator [Arenimonas sp.]|uniref:LysR family transcriptional regulator n=1 Tax=Arenimonas sp. TaxID=1872635 RepID=UPI002BDB74F1|nr:LysR family transcriptional regulator [Arenimonas sp.]HMB55870.1 LysR family transcriptional regulator [Arenimonas sp.]
MDRLEAMTVFLSAVEGGSLSAAGRKLGMPLATISRKLSDLEAHLKARLLNRSTRRLTLTDAGRDYLAACKRILEDVTDAERAAAGEFSEPRGDLVVTAPIVFGRLHVLPVIAEFLSAYPEVNVRLVQGDRVVHLLDEHVDLAVRIGELPDSRLTATRLGAIRRVVCASPDYLSAHGQPASPGELSDHRCITFDAMSAPEAWSFRVDGADISVPVRSRLMVNTAEAAIDAATTGVGVTRVLSYQIETAQRSGQLQAVLREFEPAPLPVSLVYPGQRRLPLKLRAFLDYATPRLRERLATGD